MISPSIGAARVVVYADPEIEDLIPAFLRNREADVRALKSALESGDWSGIRALGHSMKGSGAGYGFDGISEIGAALEQAAKDRDPCVVASGVAKLEDYLARVEVRYE